MAFRSAGLAYFCLLAACGAVAVCSSGGGPGPGNGGDTGLPRVVAPGVRQIGRLAHPMLDESSGLVPSRKHPDLFWTHDDGGSKHPVFLYGVTRTGATVAVYRVTGPRLHDWEDIATDGQGHLYVADIGNNDCKRAVVAVHEIDEPEPPVAAPAAAADPAPLGDCAVRRTFQLAFPERIYDCESLFVRGEYGYVINKVGGDRHATVFRFRLVEQAEPQVLEPVTLLPVSTPVAGACLSADGRRLALVGHSGAFLLRGDGDVRSFGNARPYHVRFGDRHIEGCCFVPEGLLATSESREVWLFDDAAFRGP